jgi:hypothetical protein
MRKTFVDRFQLLRCASSELPQQLELLASEGWEIVAVDLASNPCAALLLKVEPDEQALADLRAERQPEQTNERLERMLELAEALMKHIGVVLPPKADPEPPESVN